MTEDRIKILHLCTIFPQFKGDFRGIFIGRHVAAMQEYVDNCVIAPMSPITQKREKQDDVMIYRFQYWLPNKNQLVGYGIDTRRNIGGSFLAKLQVLPYLFFFMLYVLWFGRKADVYHAHTTFTAIFPVILNMFRWKKKPIIATALGSDLKFLPAWFNKLILKKISYLTFPAPLFASSGYTRPAGISLERMIQNMNAGQKFRELYYPLDERRFNPSIDNLEAKKKIGREGEFIVSFLSRLDDIKGAIYFAEAIPIVLARSPEIHFIFTSYGPLRDEIVRMTEERELSANVHFYDSPDDIETFMAASDIMCQMCTEENLWTTILAEAAVMRVPCIISNVGQTTKLYTHKKDVFIVDLSSEALADGIIELYNDAALRKEIADNGRELLNLRGRRDEISKQKYFELYASARACEN